MMDSHAYQDKSIAVFGLGKSGLATAERLKAGKADVCVWDDNEDRRKVAIEKGLRVKDLIGSDWDPTDALVLSPGVPLTHPEPHPVVGFAQKAGAEIIGDIEVFLNEKTAGRVVGITGTNGKSTTSALIHHLLIACTATLCRGENLYYPMGCQKEQ